MRRWFRFALLWLLAVAMPLQGMAAAAMMGCAGHQAAAAAPAVPHQEDMSGHDAHQAHHAGLAAMAGESPDATLASAGDGAEVQTHAAGHSCSACAACCAGFALLNAPLTLAAPEPAAGIGMGSSPRAASALEDAPERPPRPSRA